MKSLVTVLFSPTDTFDRLRSKGGWVTAFIAMIILAVVNVWLQMPLLQKIQKEAMEKAGAVQTDQAAAFTNLFSYITAPLAVAIMMFFVALLLLLVNLFVRGEATYMQLVKVSLFSSVPSVISGLLTGILIRTTGAESLQDVQLSLGAFIPDKQGIVYQLANIVNPFGIWALILMIIGTAVMARKSRASISIWIIIGWLLFALVGVLLAGMAA